MFDVPSDLSVLAAVETIEWAITDELDEWNRRNDEQSEGAAALAAVFDPVHERQLATILIARGWRPPDSTCPRTHDNLKRSHGARCTIT